MAARKSVADQRRWSQWQKPGNNDALLAIEQLAAAIENLRDECEGLERQITKGVSTP